MTKTDGLTAYAPDTLRHSIAQVGTIPLDDIANMRSELQPYLGDTLPNYEDYQRGGQWKLLALLNGSGDPHDTTVREGGQAVPTPVLDSMPTVQGVLNRFFPPANIILARVARFSPGGRLWEHVDYTELDEATPRTRFHIPIQTEPSAVFVTGGHRVHMGLGGLWAINPRGAHGIAHDGQQDRVHIIVDATVDDNLAQSPGKLDPQYVEKLPVLTDKAVADITNRLAALVINGKPDVAVDTGLNLFYKVELPSSHTTHQIIAAAFAKAGDPERHQQWLENNAKYMGGKSDDGR